MTDNEKIKELLEASSDGVITAEQVTAAGLHRSVLQALVEKGEIYRFGRGLYALCNTWEDDFYLLQRKYGRGIYSHETALYLLGYSDRTPAHYTMTFPKGYNTPSLKKENIIAKLPSLDLFNVSEIKRPKGGGMEIKFFDRLKAIDKLRELAVEQDNKEKTSFFDALEKSAAGADGAYGDGDCE